VIVRVKNGKGNGTRVVLRHLIRWEWVSYGRWFPPLFRVSDGKDSVGVLIQFV